MLRRIRFIVGILAVLMGMTFPAIAQQTSAIEYGTFTIGRLDQNVQGGFFTFNGNEGDHIAVAAVALSGTLNPRITLLNANSTTLAVNNNDPFQPGIDDARLTYRLPSTASYTLLIEAEADTDGQYLLRVERQDLPSPTPLGANVITTANVSLDVPTQVYSFDSATGTRVAVSPGDLNAVAEVYTPEGEALAILSNSAGSVSVPPNTGTYTLVVRSGTLTGSGSVEIEFGGEGASAPVESAAPLSDDTDTATTDDTAEAPATTDDTAEVPAPATTDDTAEAPATTDDTAEAPATTDDTAEAPATTDDTAEATDGDGPTVGAAAVGSDVPSDRCTVTPSDGGVVIRSGPDTDFPAIASIPIGEFRFANGTDGAWIRLVGDGWVSSGVVDLNGPCGALPLVSAATSPGGDSGGTGQQDAPPPPQPTTIAPIGSRGG